jgi:hypothetical protein
MRRRPKSLPELQMAAAVGQSRLMTQYDQLFSAEKKSSGRPPDKSRFIDYAYHNRRFEQTLGRRPVGTDKLSA